MDAAEHVDKLAGDDDADEGGEAHGAEDNPLPDEIDLSNRWIVSADEQGNVRGHEDKIHDEGQDSSRDQGSDCADDLQDGDGEHAAQKRAAAAAGPRLVLLVDAHLLILFANGNFKSSKPILSYICRSGFWGFGVLLEYLGVSGEYWLQA